jgi:hypothetical protein
MRLSPVRLVLFVLLLSAASAGAHPGAGIGVLVDGAGVFRGFSIAEQ